MVKSIVLISGIINHGTKVFMEGFELKRWGWIHWAVLIGYYIAVFFLCRGSTFLAFVLAFLPVIVLSFFGRSACSAMVDYLSYNHPEAWGRISREMYHARRHYFSLPSFDAEIDDPNYEELKNHYKKVLRTLIFSGCACFATIIFTYFTTAR